MDEVKKLREEVELIKARNKRVEADKAWETSKTRTAVIAVSTFLLIYIVMRLIGADNPELNAIISAAAYWISTESYGVLKRWWLSKRKS